MNRILLGNLISFLASLMLTAGCLMKDPKKVYAMQVAENLTLVVSSVCFGSWSGITTLLISTVRNVLLVKGHFDKKRMYLFSVLVTVCGLAVNNKGWIGLLPVLATVILTVCNYYARSSGACLSISCCGRYIFSRSGMWSRESHRLLSQW